MIYLVTGTPDSGKSAVAEELAVRTKDPHKIYLATMKVLDETGRKRVAKHRKQREGKGFVTIEREYGILRVLEMIEMPSETTVLLECVSNLVGNEMHDNPDRRSPLKQAGFPQAGISPADPSSSGPSRGAGSPEQFADEIAEEIRELAGSVHNMVIVTNEFEGGRETYDAETELYVGLLHMVNVRISAFADLQYDLLTSRKILHAGEGERV